MFRQAVRALRSGRPVSLAAFVTLAVALGACATVSAVAYAILLAPLPYASPSRLVEATRTVTFGGVVSGRNFSLSELPGWQGSGAFADTGAAAGVDFAMVTDAALASVPGAYVGGDFFDTVRPHFLAGAGFPASDDVQPVAVISAHLWREQFGGAASDVVGRALTLDGRVFTVTGVVDDDVDLPSRGTEVWVPAGIGAAAGADWIHEPRGGGFQIYARLAEGESIDAARARVSSIAAPAEVRARESGAHNIVPVRDVLASGLRPVLAMFAAAVLLLLIVACANVASLLFTRHVGRSRDIAVQRALGASRAQIVAAALAEGGILTMAAGGVGLLLASWLTQLVRLHAATWLPRAESLAISWPVAGFLAIVCLVATLACALAPALRASSSEIADALRAGGAREPGTIASRRAHRFLATLQVALSVLLLCGALLLTRSLLKLSGADIGARTHDTVTALLDLSSSRRLQAPQLVRLADAMVARVRSLPGVRVAGIGSSLPPDAARMRYTLRAAQTAAGTHDLLIDALAVTPGFFDSLGLHLESGRLFTPADGAESAPVLVMSRATAQRVFGDRDPIGRSLVLPTLKGPQPVQVVGVVSNVKFDGLDKPSDGGIYRPFAQHPLGTAFLVASGRIDPAVLRHAVAGVDPLVCVVTAGPLQDRVARAVAAPQFRAMVVSGFAGVAALLAMVGIFGVVSYSVTVRTGEMGIRSAIGAAPADLARLVIAEALGIGLAGVVVGLGVAAMATRALSSMLFGVSPLDPLALTVPCAAMVGFTVLSAWVPARRAARVDVMQALRLR